MLPIAIGLLIVLASPMPQWWRWAGPVDVPGVPNMHRVDDGLYRGARPTEAGLRELKAMGVRTVIDLAGFPDERKMAESAGLNYVPIPMVYYRADERFLVEFLRTVDDERRGPFFVHCAQGSNRTGTMIAVYRVAVQGWDRRQAAMEMTCGGFGFDAGNYPELIEYLDGLDIEELRRRVGLPP